MMNRSLTCVFSAFLLAVLSGCAPMISGSMNAGMTPEIAKQKTAEYFGVSEKKIDLYNFDKGALATTYKIHYAKKIYNCQIYYGAVNCAVPGGQ